MTGVIATIPKYQFSTNGVPLVNGTLTTYLAGSTTLTTTWQDLALTVANTNPIVLDSRGECILYLDSTKVYKFVLKNSAGTTLWTQDNIPAGGLAETLRTNLAASTGATLIGWIQNAIGAVARTIANKLYESLSVKDFGAVGDGSTDDTAAFNAAIAHCKLIGQTRLFIPRGIYNITSTITIEGLRGLKIYGEGWSIDVGAGEGSIIRYTAAGASSMIAIESCAGLQVDGVAFTYNNASYTGELVTTDNPDGLDTTNYEFRFCVFQGEPITDTTAYTGAASLLRLKKSIIGNVKNCVFKHAQRGMTLYSYLNVTDIENCTFLGLVQKSIYAYNLGTIESLSIKRCTFEPLSTGQCAGFDYEVGLAIKTFVYESNWHGDVTVAGGGQWVNIANSNAVTISKNLFGTAGTGVNDYAIRMASNSGFEISGNTFFDKAIEFTNASTGGVVKSNLFTTVTNFIKGRSFVSPYSTWTSNTGLEGYGRSKAYMSSNLTLANTTFTAVPFQANLYDQGGVHSTSVNNTRFTVPVGSAGLWEFKGAVQFGTGGAGTQVIMQIQKNGSSIIMQKVAALAAAVTVQESFVAEDVAVDGGYYELRIWQNTGANMTVVGLGAYAVDTYMAAHKVMTGD